MHTLSYQKLYMRSWVLVVSICYGFGYFVMGHIDGRPSINFQNKITCPEFSALVGRSILLDMKGCLVMDTMIC